MGLRIALATIYRILYALAGFAVVVINALIERKVVDWDPLIAVYVASGVGFLALFDNLRLLKYKFDARERNAARTRMMVALVTALDLIAERRSVRLPQLGASVFGIKRRWTRKCFVVPWYEQRLQRLLRFRLSEYPPESSVVWTRGKGAIGACWEKNIPVLVDRRPVSALYGRPRHPTETQFDALTEEERRGFTYSEFIQTIDKYGEILAVPIVAKNSGEQIGVLSIDCLAESYADQHAPPILSGKEIEAFAGRAAKLVREDVGQF